MPIYPVTIIAHLTTAHQRPKLGPLRRRRNYVDILRIGVLLLQQRCIDAGQRVHFDDRRIHVVVTEIGRLIGLIANGAVRCGGQLRHEITIITVHHFDHCNRNEVEGNVSLNVIWLASKTIAKTHGNQLNYGTSDTVARSRTDTIAYRPMNRDKRTDPGPAHTPDRIFRKWRRWADAP